MKYGRVNANMVKLLAPDFVMQVEECSPYVLLSLLNKINEKPIVQEHWTLIFQRANVESNGDCST